MPHRPFGFDENCKFDGGRQSGGGEKWDHTITEDELIIQHNLERNCVVYFLDIFLDNLRKQDYWEDLEIFQYTVIAAPPAAKTAANPCNNKVPVPGSR